MAPEQGRAVRFDKSGLAIPCPHPIDADTSRDGGGVQGSAARCFRLRESLREWNGPVDG